MKTKDIPGYEGLYYYNENGEVFNKHNRPVKVDNIGGKYPRYRLYKNGERSSLMKRFVDRWAANLKGGK